MKWLLVLLAVASIETSLVGQEIQVLEFSEFKFESGSVVPNVKLVYKTIGTLNAEKSNAVLLPSHYGADHSGYDYLIGPDKELDPSKYFLILTNMFSNGLSSSPSNTPSPFNGPRFPQVSIRDNVEAQHRLVLETLGIDKLKAIVGFSMGGQQAFQWAVSHPDMMEAIVVVCSNAKQYPFGIVRLQGSITALKADGEFNDGNYTHPPEKGLRAMSMHYRAWTRSPSAWPRDLFDDLNQQQLEQTLTSFSGGFLSLDANNLLSQAETWKRHDVGDSAGFEGSVENALRSIKARVLLLPTTTDQYFPQSDSLFESQFIQHVELLPIETVFGHTGGGGTDPDATKAIDLAIGAFFDSSNEVDTSDIPAAMEQLNLRQATIVPSSDGSLFLVAPGKDNQNRMLAIRVEAVRPNADSRLAEKDVSQLVGRDIYQAKLLDSNGVLHSLRELAGRPHMVVLIKGAFCRLCMEQLSEFQQRLDPEKIPIVVVTPVNDLAELADLPFQVYYDRELYLFKNLGAFSTEPLHGTFIFDSVGAIQLKDVGEEPFTNWLEIESALARSLKQVNK